MDELNRDLKMYICVREEVPAHMVPVLVAHTVLNAHNHFIFNSEDGVREWYHNWFRDSFKKCVVQVNDKEWKKIVSNPYTYLGHENSTMNGEKSCAIIPIMYEYPNVIKFARLWKP